MAKQVPQQEPSLPEGTQTITDLAQIRALADPLRQRILGALAGPPRTTKQVAQLLGEKPTKLYHHVAALERVGLIRLKETRPVRGAVEKYYQAVAARFQASSSALSPGGCSGDEPSELWAMLESILDTARGELLANLRPAGAPRPKPVKAPLVARVLIRGSHKDIQAAHRRVLRWVEGLRSAAANHTPPKEDDLTYALTILFCRADAARD